MRTQVAPLAVMTVCVSGCSSGVAGFVKYTPDSRHIIYNDSGYVRAYIHRVPTGKTYAFEGSLACEALDGRRWVITPAPLNSDKSLFLVSVQADREPVITRLPPLPGIGTMSSVAAAFGPDDEELYVYHCLDSGRGKCFAFRLNMKKAKWQELQSETDRSAVRERTWGCPKDSIGGLGYVPPSPFRYRDGSGEHVQRVKETQDRSGYRYEDRLTSPDGNTYVTIRADLPSVSWALGSGQTTLTDVATGKTRVLISNTDLAWRLWVGCIWGPSAGVTMAVLQPNI